MKLKYLSALVLGVILSLPTQAQVYLDSTEVANILHPKAVTVVQTKVASVANDDNEEEEDTDSIIPAFATDSRLSWKENITARLDGILRSPLLETVQTSLMVVLGFLLIVVTIRAVDRAIHTKYVLTDDGVLLVKTGRVGLTKRVPLSDVKTVEKRPFAFRLGYYALLEMMNGSVVSVQPDNVDNFLSALKKRLEKKDNEV